MSLYFYVDMRDRLIMRYCPEWGAPGISSLVNSIIKKTNVGSRYLFKKTFYLSTENIISNHIEYEDDESLLFEIGHLEEDQYIYLDKDVFNIDFEFAFFQRFVLYQKYFSKDKISLIKILSKTLKQNIYIDDNRETNFNTGHISLNDYKILVSKVPTKKEHELYTLASIQNIAEQFFEEIPDYKKNFEEYLIKHRKDKPYIENFSSSYYQFKIDEYNALKRELKTMLGDESISELQWQNKIMDLIRIIYPKYLYVIPQFEFSSLGKIKKPDFLVIDSDGNVDVIEIKKANIGSLLKVYRNDYVPKSELSGSLVQLEQYIYLLKCNKKKIEKEIEENYSNLIGKTKIRIINPQGIIIAGRSDKMNENELEDFEVIKRMYKNISEIITYDELLKRFENSINSFKKNQNKNM